MKVRDPRAGSVPAALATVSVAASTISAAWLVAGDAWQSVDTWSLLVTAVGTSALGLLVLWRRHGHRVGWLLVLAGLAFATAGSASGVLATASAGSGAPAGVLHVAFAALWLSQGPLVVIWVLLLLGLPEGAVGGGWRRWLAWTTTFVAPSLALTGYLLAPQGRGPQFPSSEVPPDLSGPLAQSLSWPWLLDAGTLVAAGLPLAALLGLLLRFSRADGVTRQQLKWVVLAAGITVLVNVVAAVLGPEAVTLSLAAQIVPSLGIALAVLRYRLWDVDVLIVRATLIVALWAGLWGLFLAAAMAAGMIVGGADLAASLAVALMVAVALRPVRGRGERWMRRRVFGPSPEGYAAVMGFAEAIAGAKDNTELAGRVADQVRRSLSTEWAAVWLLLEADGARHLWLAAIDSVSPAVDAAEGRSVLITDELAQGLRDIETALVSELPEGLPPAPPGLPCPAAVAALRTGDSLIGVLSVGHPARRRLGEPDLELLSVLAAEATLTLQNTRLEAELRQQLEQIKEQSEQISRSRHRLVSVQDQQRRRIERDLHDGVQQQLVSLAAGLRRLAAGQQDSTREPLERFADRAEESVFALQDFARGIYPTVLVDRGLVAALRTQLARVAADIHLDVEPRLGNRRFGFDVESACYFVALESVTNAQKYAPGAAVSVRIRQDSTCSLVVEVHDNGPGFSPGDVSGGTGLENMADRAAAIAGQLSVDSCRGGGTRISMLAPIAADRDHSEP